MKQMARNMTMAGEGMFNGPFFSRKEKGIPGEICLIPTRFERFAIFRRIAGGKPGRAFAAQQSIGHWEIMKTVRVKIMLSWLLFLAFVVAVCLNHNFVAWLVINPIQLLVRLSMPKPIARPGHPVLERCMTFILRTGIILFLVLLLIHVLHPFPPAVLNGGEIFGLLYLAPVIAYAIYLDCSTLKQSRGSSA